MRNPANIETINAGDVIKDGHCAMDVLHVRCLSHSTYIRVRVQGAGCLARVETIGAHNGYQVEVVSRYLKSDADGSRCAGKPPRQDDSNYGLETLQECSP